ncbi:MAG TPA: STAS domain-containing protein [Bryobacteraceae bacterium]|jgi:rsbT co-antagonist protein RsbR
MQNRRLAQIVGHSEGPLLADWMETQLRSLASARDRISESELRVNSHDFVLGLQRSLSAGGTSDIATPAWAGLREMLANLSRQRAIRGFSPSETATFVFSFKSALFKQLRQAFRDDAQALADETWIATDLLDKLGLFTTEVFQKSREELILRQQQEMLELSTPVVELWPGILAVPLIGTLDSARTQIVMQNLLEAVVAKEANLAIIDITGVPTVDTVVAQHLLKTVSAARLMGAECIVSGIRPQIAQTIIHLGVDLTGVITKASLADALRIALQKKGLAVGKA